MYTKSHATQTRVFGRSLWPLQGTKQSLIVVAGTPANHILVEGSPHSAIPQRAPAVLTKHTRMNTTYPYLGLRGSR
jgi:hypothetical protein